MYKFWHCIARFALGRMFGISNEQADSYIGYIYEREISLWETE